MKIVIDVPENPSVQDVINAFSIATGMFELENNELDEICRCNLKRKKITCNSMECIGDCQFIK